ncbi:MAG: DNA polymerase III subunit delta' C-terminal domain-containing protein [Acidobacteriota bacterium]
MSFNDLIGNSRVKMILGSYMKNESIPLSMIFFGPSNANIHDFAIAYAKAINCKESSHDFCDSCKNCVDISKDIFPDLKILYPEGQFYKKEQISFLIEDNYRRPLTGEKKIYILNEAERMNESSANSFLKVLEEPADSSVFILITKNLTKLLPTIRSRCQILTFYSPSKVEIRQYLSKLGFDEKRSELLASLSISGKDNILKEDYFSLMENRESVFFILESLIKKNKVEDVLLNLSHKSRTRAKFIEYFNDILNLISVMLRDIMILKIDNNSDFLINIDYIEKLEDLGKYINIEKVLYLIRRMEFILRDIKRNLNSKVLILEFINSYA